MPGARPKPRVAPFEISRSAGEHRVRLDRPSGSGAPASGAGLAVTHRTHRVAAYAATVMYLVNLGRRCQMQNRPARGLLALSVPGAILVATAGYLGGEWVDGKFSHRSRRVGGMRARANRRPLLVPRMNYASAPPASKNSTMRESPDRSRRSSPSSRVSMGTIRSAIRPCVDVSLSQGCERISSRPVQLDSSAAKMTRMASRPAAPLTGLSVSSSR
jgi:hypothetical protein